MIAAFHNDDAATPIVLMGYYNPIYSADEIAAAAHRAGIPATPATGVDAALETIRRDAPAPTRVLICGSLYLAGTVLATEAGTALASRPTATII